MLASISWITRRRARRLVVEASWMLFFFHLLSFTCLTTEDKNEEMAGGGMTLATHATGTASTTAVKQDMHRKLQRPLKKKLQKPPVVTFIETEALRWTRYCSLWTWPYPDMATSYWENQVNIGILLWMCSMCLSDYNPIAKGCILTPCVWRLVLIKCDHMDQVSWDKTVFFHAT